MQRRNRGFLCAAVILLALTGGLQAAARTAGGFAEWYARRIYPAIVGVIGRLFGLFPFSVAEMLIYILVILMVVGIALFWRKPMFLAARGIFLAAVLLFLYTVNCGINYYAEPFSGYAGLQTGWYTREELRSLCEMLVEKVNENATDEGYADHRSAWRQEGVRAMGRAAEKFPCLGGYYPLPKQVTVSQILSVQQLCGIYAPFTVEANFNGAMPDYNIPHTICHELSHLKGFMREDEANFIGYLACIRSDTRAFRYSGYLTGWVYAGNALAGVDREAYMELRGRLCAQAETDLQANSDFWNRYESRVSEAANQWNDTYLKMNDQADGVQSYGRVVDLMLAYYQGQF